jgi:LmbE family N-acetylglucosaminyl deacetylase
MTNLYSELEAQAEPLTPPTRVLTIGAHPDDAEFAAGAALARWAADGADITMCVVTDGSKGSWDPEEDTDALIKRRHTEQRAAGAVIGAGRFVHLGYVDGELEYSMALRRELAHQIRLLRPDFVLSHDPWQRYQLHPDHRVTGFAAVDAVVAAREPLAYPDMELPSHRPSALLLWSADEPDHAEPVAPEWFTRKVDALLCHSSQAQTTMGDADQGVDKRIRFESQLATWQDAGGARFGVGQAETFKRITP